MEASEPLHAICEQIINGQVPERAKQWLYVHRVVALSKLSNHQQDIEQRLKARADGDTEYTALLPIDPHPWDSQHAAGSCSSPRVRG